MSREIYNEEGDKLPLRPIISNIGTATYDVAMYLAKVLPPLGKSQYLFSNIKNLIRALNTESVPSECDLTSFDVMSLSINVPLEYLIDIILCRIYDDHEIETISYEKK